MAEKKVALENLSRRRAATEAAQQVCQVELTTLGARFTEQIAEDVRLCAIFLDLRDRAVSHLQRQAATCRFNAYEFNNIYARFYIAARNALSAPLADADNGTGAEADAQGLLRDCFGKMQKELCEKSMEALPWVVSSLSDAAAAAFSRGTGSGVSSAAEEADVTNGGIIDGNCDACVVPGDGSRGDSDTGGAGNDGSVATRSMNSSCHVIGVSTDAVLARLEADEEERLFTFKGHASKLSMRVPLHVRGRLRERILTFLRGLPNLDVDERDTLATRLFRVTVLNYIIASSSLYWGFGPDVYLSAEAAGAVLECYASPFNHSLDHFCSPCAPLDLIFGSLGSFYHSRVSRFVERLPAGAILVANPPYLESELLACTRQVQNLLMATAKQPLSAVSIFPNWRGAEGLELYRAWVQKEGGLVEELPKYGHEYYDYQDCRRIVARFDSLGFAITSSCGSSGGGNDGGTDCASGELASVAGSKTMAHEKVAQIFELLREGSQQKKKQRRRK
eukprot:TRINITY_DN38880_c0_g1_i1.p1 TRINITY_DN38880_c0_g1~~TRINITY_DN38880_c0_g1_i1.p1  ORF type:complete len:506 (-),score=103.80 TRINITY_DN38880_c0_g1_i1:66-1583(-)